MATADTENFGLEVLEDVSSSDEMAMSEIYKTLTVNEDIILVIDKESEETLRKGLIAMKYKANKAAKDASMDFDNRTLEFKVIDWTPTEVSSDPSCSTKTKIQIYLKAKSAIRVHRLIVTDKEF